MVSSVENGTASKRSKRAKSTRPPAEAALDPNFAVSVVAAPIPGIIAAPKIPIPIPALRKRSRRETPFSRTSENTVFSLSLLIKSSCAAFR